MIHKECQSNHEANLHLVRIWTIDEMSEGRIHRTLMLGAFPFKWFKVCQVVPAEHCVLRRLLHSGTLKWKCEGTKR